MDFTRSVMKVNYIVPDISHNHSTSNNTRIVKCDMVLGNVV